MVQGLAKLCGSSCSLNTCEWRLILFILNFKCKVHTTAAALCCTSRKLAFIYTFVPFAIEILSVSFKRVTQSSMSRNHFFYRKNCFLFCMK